MRVPLAGTLIKASSGLTFKLCEVRAALDSAKQSIATAMQVTSSTTLDRSVCTQQTLHSRPDEQCTSGTTPIKRCKRQLTKQLYAAKLQYSNREGKHVNGDTCRRTTLLCRSGSGLRAAEHDVKSCPTGRLVKHRRMSACSAANR